MLAWLRVELMADDDEEAGAEAAGTLPSAALEAVGSGYAGTARCSLTACVIKLRIPCGWQIPSISRRN